MRKIKKKRKDNKRLLIFFLVLFLSVGFAALSKTVNILGAALIKGNETMVDVHFENIKIVDGSVMIDEPELSNNDTQLYFQLLLTKPGDYLEFMVDAKNYSDIDVMVDTFNDITLYDPETEKAVETPDYLDISVTYSDRTEILKKHLLKSGDKTTYRVKVEYKFDIDKDRIELNNRMFKAKFNIKYKQADETAIEKEKKYATLLSGSEVNDHIMLTSGGVQNNGNSNYGTESVSYIKKAMRLDSNYNSDEYIVSTNDSEVPIYMWYNKKDSTLYYYSDAYAIYLNENSSGLFSSIKSLVGIDFDFDTSEVIDASHLFEKCNNLEELNLSGFENTKDMSYMFSECNSLNKLNIENLITNNVTNMSYMFNLCGNLKELDFSNFKTGNVTNMSHMFSNCSGLKTLNLNTFDTSNVEDMSYMFYWSGISSVNLESFNTEKVKYMNNMFHYCSSLSSIDLTSFNNINVQSMASMFAHSRLQTITTGDKFVTKSVKNLKELFYWTYLKNIDVSKWDTSGVTDMSYLFSITDVSSLDFSNWNTSKVTNMENMFYSTDFTELDLTSFDTRNVTDMNHMFRSMDKLEVLDISSFDTNKVTDMHQMFAYDSKLTTVYVGPYFSTAKVTNSNSIFSDCKLLTGGNGTKYSSSIGTITYARPDGYTCTYSTGICESSTIKGLFTYKELKAS